MPRHAALLTLLLTPASAVAQPARQVEFNRDVRPILSDACFQCHGPDQRNRKGGLRLDTEDGARAAVAGGPAKSELLRRVLAKDPSQRMPPPSSAHTLSPEQIDVLRTWVARGAPWQRHWSLLPPVRPDFPPVHNPGWCRNGIDRFVLARLEKEGLAPSPEADRVTLLRRVTLDLTGLPPTPAEVDAFLADERPDAYERAVDRLLASPRYGERMAIKWAQAARYADTNGYQGDGDRVMWRWRDWVIDAYNRNLPFDRFTVEQLAGDLLPNPTLEQLIATGFNRNHRGNAEGGIVPEEYAVEYVVDRVDTTATVWLGLSMGCARCHDHKYDPISMQDFYRTFAYFNNVPERGKVVRFGNSPPVVLSPTRDQQAELDRLRAELRASEERLARRSAFLDAEQAAWEKTVRPGDVDGERFSFLARRLAHFRLDGDEPGVAFRGGPPAYASGRLGKAAALDGKRYLDVGDVGDFDFKDSFTILAWVYAEGDGTLVSRMADDDRGEGYGLALVGGRLRAHFAKRWLDDAIHVETQRALAPRQWHHVAMTYDGSRLAAGVKLYLDGRPEPVHVLLDDLNQSFRTARPLRIGTGGERGAPFRGRIDEVRLYDDWLAEEDILALSAPEDLATTLATPPQQRTAAQTARLRSHYLAAHAAPEVRQLRHSVLRQRKHLERYLATLPTTMVMQEMDPPRETHLLLRGEYDRKGPKVTPGVPASLPQLPAGEPNNRLGFARWLVHPSNPLTARVAVNRAWQLFFGAGIVRSVEEFGSQGDWPSHPELLDWLAVEFRRDWDVKRLHRLIVTSAAYRQSSRQTPQLRERDPENRLLARGPRVRLPAEMIRDQALSASGLLVERVGGPSVRPYQPADLWKGLANEDYEQDSGPALYRRSLYTYWKRTIAPPGMATFDAPGREACAVREVRTNTPLQALNLMNDVTYVEAARGLAQRVLKSAEGVDARLTLAFRLVTARAPRAAELAILRAGLESNLARFRTDRKAALRLVNVGESPRDERLDVAELAAWTTIASLLLNLDEAVVKE